MLTLEIEGSWSVGKGSECESLNEESEGNFGESEENKNQ